VPSVLEYLQSIAGPARVAELPDGELLERFLGCNDKLAFTTLLDRHGPMVLGVCRRILSDPNDAEDSFQATFLVLVRKGRSIEKHDSLASWLFGVARRIAVHAKCGAARRQVEGHARTVPRGDASPRPEGNELGRVLDQEVAQLPERCRAPFILCYLEGKTNEEAARLLGCPKGTVLSRLARARQLLRARLTRRGVTLSGGVMSTMGLGNAQAMVPRALSASTLESACATAAGKALPAEAVSANVAAFTEGMVRAMSLHALRMALTACLVVALTSGLVALGAYQALATGQPIQDSTVSPAKKGEKQTGDSQKLQGTWEVTQAIMGGQEVPLERVPLTRIRFSGDTMSLVFGNAIKKKPEGTLSIKLDPSKKPKAIDFVVLDGDHKGEKGAGIYALEGDRLRVCLPDGENKRRPAEFTAPEGSNLMVLTLKRASKDR
jgi:RNA polymerase sigma factor (sigma-70 family)